MTLNLPRTNQLKGTIQLPYSKSIFNRLLILQANYTTIQLPELPNIDDVKELERAIQMKNGVVDVGAAGSAMRFATAYFAATPDCNIELMGSQRMHQRSIGELVRALQTLGAQIEYLEKDGFPPLKIHGKKLKGGNVELHADVSSQFITALLLLAPKMKNGLTIKLVGEPVSQPYIIMTTGLMKKVGFKVEETQSSISVSPVAELNHVEINVEADWSAAAYWYGWVALADDSEIILSGLEAESYQGDKRLATIFSELGVRTAFIEGGVRLTKRAVQLPSKLVINLLDNPDLAQPIAFTCAMLGIGVELTGLQTLPGKETNRLKAMQLELKKIGVKAEITDRSIRFKESVVKKPAETFNTYDDHRMAMAVSLVSSKFDISVNHPGVVSKSYPTYWTDLEQVRS